MLKGMYGTQNTRMREENVNIIIIISECTSEKLKDENGEKLF